MLFWLARLCATIGYQMMALVIGWQLYQLTNSAFDLGLVGLIQFVPAVVLTLLIGHAADRYDRRLIIRAAQSDLCAGRGVITVALLARRAQPRPAVRRRVPDRLRARLRSADRQRAGAGAGAGAADHARGRRLDLGQPGGGDLRAGAGRADLCGQSRSRSPRSASLFFQRPSLRQFHRRQGPGRQPRAADLRLGAGRLRIHPHAAAAARRHHARPVRGAARRRHRAAADLSPATSWQSARSASACCARRRRPAR